MFPSFTKCILNCANAKLYPGKLHGKVFLGMALRDRISNEYEVPDTPPNSSAMTKLLVRRFFEENHFIDLSTSKEEITSALDKFLHVDVMRKFEAEELPRLHFQADGTDRFFVDYPDARGLENIVFLVCRDVFSALGHSSIAKTRGYSDIRGRVERFEFIQMR